MFCPAQNNVVCHLYRNIRRTLKTFTASVSTELDTNWRLSAFILASSSNILASYRWHHIFSVYLGKNCFCLLTRSLNIKARSNLVDDFKGITSIKKFWNLCLVSVGQTLKILSQRLQVRKPFQKKTFRRNIDYIKSTLGRRPDII